jgi:putative glycosyltransferase (TIGR04372 family)
VLIIRIIKPLLLVRIGSLNNERIGHFAANTELYCCERDEGINTPDGFFVDLFFVSRQVCNFQLLKMWKRVLYVYPEWLLSPIQRLNNLIPGGEEHNIQTSQNDRDIHNLLEKLPCHVKFTPEDKAFAEQEMQKIGVPDNVPFVCLIVRDSAYLDHYQPQNHWEYHNYRDADIDNYILASEALAERGYYVIRMGVSVYKPLKSDHPKIIDYAFNGLHTDFMDIWLGAHCAFCISLGTGFDAVPVIFRRPIVYVNYVPIGYFNSVKESLGLFKHHYQLEGELELTLSEIIGCDEVHLALHASTYTDKGIGLKENTPEEIKAIALEMADRIEGTWIEESGDSELQDKFWKLFPSDAKTSNGVPLHGDIRARYGAVSLRNNHWWLK